MVKIGAWPPRQINRPHAAAPDFSFNLESANFVGHRFAHRVRKTAARLQGALIIRSGAQNCEGALTQAVVIAGGVLDKRFALGCVDAQCSFDKIDSAPFKIVIR